MRDIRVDKPLKAGGRHRGRTRLIQGIPSSIQGVLLIYMGMTIAEAPHGAMNCN
jgi:hypothetical protein